MDRFRDELRRFVNLADDADGALSLALAALPSAEAYRASFNGRLILPSPLPAAWMGDALAQADRAVRWAIRATEESATIGALQMMGARAVGTEYGLRITEVQPGSFDFGSGGTDRLYKALNSKPVVFGLALLAALELLGYGPHIEWGDAGQQPQIAQVIVPPANVEVTQQTFTLVVEVDGDAVRFVCNTPARQPRH